jgi:hypothetical protein
MALARNVIDCIHIILNIEFILYFYCGLNASGLEGILLVSTGSIIRPLNLVSTGSQSILLGF